MSTNTHYWADADRSINLINLFEYLHYTSVHETSTYRVYEKSRAYYTVIYTDQGYWYYTFENPKLKLRGSNLIRSFCSMIVTGEGKSIWEKIATKYQEYLDSSTDATPVSLTSVALSFNHFESLAIQVNTDSLIPLYSEAMGEPMIEKRMAMNKKKEVLFPLYSGANTICGYLKDTPSGMQPYPDYINIEAGIWYTSLPKNINTLIIFSTPKDAIAFYMQFKPENTVCIACTTINHKISTMLLELKKLSKAKKMYLAFTGSTTLQGYLKHLYFLQELQPLEFVLNYDREYIELQLRQTEDEAFFKFYKKVTEFNKSIATMYKKHNHTRNVNQLLIVENSIMPKRIDSNTVHIRIPMEVNAVQFIVWAYYQYLLPSDMMILKPRELNWFKQYMKNDAIKSFKTFKLAV